MSAGANLTQWFAWLIMILTGSMNEKGGAWFHPGFLNRYENGELPVFESAFTPGSNVRPDVKGIVGDWRNHFQPEHVRRFDEACGDLLSILGYERDAAAPAG